MLETVNESGWSVLKGARIALISIPFPSVSLALVVSVDAKHYQSISVSMIGALFP